LCLSFPADVIRYKFRALDTTVGRVCWVQKRIRRDRSSSRTLLFCLSCPALPPAVSVYLFLSADNGIAAALPVVPKGIRDARDATSSPSKTTSMLLPLLLLLQRQRDGGKNKRKGRYEAMENETRQGVEGSATRGW